MKEKNILKTENFLKVAAVILATISAITTEEGFRLIWNNDTPISYLISFGFAIAVSLVIVFCSLKVQQYFREGKGVYLVIVFLFFAMTSLFFNFNSLYGNFIKDNLLNEDAKYIKQQLTSIHTKSVNAIDKHFNYSYNKAYHDSLVLAAEREAKDMYRPGKREKWRVIDLQIPGAKAKLDISYTDFSNAKSSIDSMYESSIALVQLKEDETVERIAIENAIEGYNQIGMFTQGITSTFKFDIEKFKNNSGEPDFALITLYNFFTFNGKLSEKERFSTIIALIISLSLDFLVFFALVMLNLKTKKKTVKNGNIFGEETERTTTKTTNKITWD